MLSSDGDQFDAICFGGGSLQAVSFFPEVHAIERTIGGRLNTVVKHFAGISVGSIFAIVLGSGATSVDFGDQVERIIDGAFKCNIHTMWKTCGMDDGTALERNLVEVLYNLGIDAQMTIGEYEKHYAVTLSIIAFDAYAVETIVMPPHATLIQGIRCSSAIPFIFSPYFFEDKLYLDGAFGNYRVPSILDTSRKWLWLRLNSTLTKPVSTQRPAYEDLVTIVLLAIRRPGDVAPKCDHVMERCIPPDSRVPTTLLNIDQATMRRVRSDAFITPAVCRYSFCARSSECLA